MIEKLFDDNELSEEALAARGVKPGPAKLFNKKFQSWKIKNSNPST